MSVIAVIDTARRVYRITKSFTKRAASENPYSRYAEHFPPNYRPYIKDTLRGIDVAFSGGLISEAIRSGIDALPISTKKSTNKFDQTRNKFKSASRRFVSRYKYGCYRPRRNSRSKY